MGKRRANKSMQAQRGLAESKKRYRNKQRCLLFAARGVTSQHRHFMEDIRTLMPHSKKEVKLDPKVNLSQELNEICDMDDCNSCIFLESRRGQDLYMWVGRTPNGPSAKFLVTNINTASELRMTGNCMKGSRPLLSFDENFDTEPHLKLLKKFFGRLNSSEHVHLVFPLQTLGTPQMHPKSKPFHDHVLQFHYLDNRIWFRNFQILWPANKGDIPELAEIGPRCVLHPIRIFSGSFGGETLYENPHYIAPSKLRSMQKYKSDAKFRDRKLNKKGTEIRKKETDVAPSEIDTVFRD